MRELLKEFEPEPEVLLREISKYVTDEMLECISTADYGQEADCHFKALQVIRDTGVFPDKISWHPMEVLELIRWSEPEQPDWKPGRTGEFGHWMRAFSCAAILRAEQEPYLYRYNDGSIDSTVGQLIISLRNLPVDFNSQAASHFSWLLLQSDPEGESCSVPVYAMGILWFALHAVHSVPEETLLALVKWLVRRADELCGRPSAGGRSGLSDMVLNCQKRKAWDLMGRRLCELDLTGYSTDFRAWITFVGEQLAG